LVLGGHRTPLRIMINDKNKLLILSIAIILGASIIAFAIMNKPLSSKDDCYYKVYKKYKSEGKSAARAAEWARDDCE